MRRRHAAVGVLIVGLTGGIGSGKTAVATLFESLGAPVIDTDELARVVVEPGTPALERIVAHFGEDLRAADGGLERARLRERVFGDPAQRRWLEQLLHPLIEAELRQRLARLDADYAVVVVPLLFESGFDRLVDRVLVVDAPADLQQARVAARDGVPAEQIAAIVAAQLDARERRRRADDLLENDGTLEELARGVAQLDRRYRELAGETTER